MKNKCSWRFVKTKPSLTTLQTITLVLVSICSLISTKTYANKIVYMSNNSIEKTITFQTTIKGKVTDEQGTPLIGVTVLIKGTNNGVSTDFDGNFSIKANKGDTLIFTYIGFENKEIIVDNKTNLQIVLNEDTLQLEEVVVTALGIKREEKKLGYSQQKINSEDLMQTLPNNWSSGLKGKIAGLNILSSGSGPINSQQITLRGNGSLNPNGNNALIVVDGVPMTSEITTSGSSTAYAGSDSPIDYGNSLSDLNIDDIENVTVLKGPGATALYGSRAANGALIITTKSGKSSSKWGISINSGTTFDVIQRYPDYQYTYGQGTGKSFNANGEPYYSYGNSEDGRSTGGTSSAWGPKFNGQSYYQYDSELFGQSTERQLWRPYRDNRKDFWRTGITQTNNLTVQGKGDKGSMRASLGYQKNEWIMPNTGFDRINLSINSQYQVSDKINLSSTVNFTNRTSNNIPSTGYNNGSIAYFMIFQNPNVDLNWYRDIWEEGKKNIQQIQPFSSYIDNPYLIAYEATNPLVSNQIVGNLKATINLAPNLDLMLRTSINTYSQEREQRRPYSINRYARGFYKTQDIFKQEVNSDLLISYQKEINKTWNLEASFGANAMNYKYRRTNAEVEGLVVPGVYKLANGINNPIITTSDRNKKVNSVYGLVSLSYDNKIFVDVTGRNDWSSTLPVQNNSFFYPSVNTSFIVSDIFNLPNAISFLKYRFSYAQVGNDTDPYRTSKYYSQNAFPSSATAPRTLFNKNFKPEITTSYETGLEARLFKNRLGFNTTLYQTFSKNQIISVPLDYSTGFSSALLNSGVVRNQGIEMSLWSKIVNSKKFKWKSTINWSKNENKVLELADGIEGQQEIGSAGQARIIAKVGGTTTAIYGYGFDRAPDGQILYDNRGLPAYPDEIKYIGDATPDWKAGWYNNFNLGNFNFSFTVDGQYGGIIYSQTHHKLTQQGKLTSTFKGREDGFIIGEGVVDNGDGTYSPNTKEVLPPDWYNRYYRRANVESNSFDASFIKLREVSLGYSFPKKLLKGTGLNKISLSVFGRNLGWISDFPIYDPETATLNGNTFIPGAEIGQMPSPASYGFNLKFDM